METAMNQLFILGADDPEMSVIESLLRSCGAHFIHAFDAQTDQRVTPGNAYSYVPTPQTLAEAAGATLVFVECGVDPLPDGAIRVDHHRPGDPGYGKPPAEYWKASSIGQVWALICDRISAGQNWDGEESVGSGHTLSELRMIAAADHCLAAAYAGQCPGVDPKALREWRVRQRAAFQRRSEAEILADTQRAEAALESAPRLRLTPWEPTTQVWCGQCRERRYAGEADFYGMCCPACGSAIIDTELVADLRATFVPELPEAACIAGIAYLATVEERDGRKKVVLGGCGAGTLPGTAPVEAFLNGWAEVQGLITIYGDPVRGFAGGYCQ